MGKLNVFFRSYFLAPELLLLNFDKMFAIQIDRVDCNDVQMKIKQVFFYFKTFGYWIIPEDLFNPFDEKDSSG